MTLPPQLLRSLEAALGTVARASAVRGGCVASALRVEAAGRVLFVKYLAGGPPGLFPAEAEGLRRLAAAADGAVLVPEVVCVAPGEVPAWIALEWLDARPSAAGFHERLGHGLAAIHGAGQAAWGGGPDNFIGTLTQANEPARSWAEFWRDRRLEPQLRRATGEGRRPGSRAGWDALLARLPDLLGPAEAEGPSVLHGDLWSGNVMATAHGPVLVDPAAYHGHREVDLAMAGLFGGFGDAFFAAYQEALPLQPGYAVRRRVYQLYYLLVHVNLFGGGYVGQTAQLLRRCLRD